MEGELPGRKVGECPSLAVSDFLQLGCGVRVGSRPLFEAALAFAFDHLELGSTSLPIARDQDHADRELLRHDTIAEQPTRRPIEVDVDIERSSERLRDSGNGLIWLSSEQVAQRHCPSWRHQVAPNGQREVARAHATASAAWLAIQDLTTSSRLDC
jgi:hypothetical protein